MTPKQQIAALQAENAILRQQNEDMARGGVHWWHILRRIATLLGCSRLSDVEGRVKEIQTTIQDYPDWGPMTSSDRDLFTKRFQDAITKGPNDDRAGRPTS